MANMYRSVLSGGGAAVGDATAADVLTGKTFSGAVGSGVAGTMPNNGAVSGTATPSQPYTIPAGYHNGSGVVTAVGSGNPVADLADNTYATVSLTGGIVVSQIVSGTAIPIADGKSVFGNIKDFSTAAAAAQSIDYNTRVSNDGTNWVSVSAGSGNVENYKYFISTSGTTGATITFTT